MHVALAISDASIACLIASSAAGVAAMVVGGAVAVGSCAAVVEVGTAVAIGADGAAVVAGAGAATLGLERPLSGLDHFIIASYILMSMMTSMEESRYEWPLVGEFRNRVSELGRLEEWWGDASREPLAMFGRRRVGKSWLFRRFAHGKEALVLVAEQLPAHAQLARFAADLEPLLGVRPDLPDVATLFRVLFRAARSRKLLVVIDEFPWLLSPGAAEGFRDLTSIQAAMEEERDRSMIKLVLCGSQVGQMEALFGERNPMHGRLRPMAVRPLSFAEAAPFLVSHDPISAFERYAVSGGMPMYLSRLAEGRLRDVVCRNVLDRDSPLWNEGRVIIDRELREPRVYFALLEQLATGPKALNEIAQPLDMTTGAVAKYLSTLIDLRLVSKKEPFGAEPRGRSGRWQLDDAFLRFWFRFVFPFQADLEAGLPSGALFDSEVQPAMAEHAAAMFEAWALEWLRANRADVASRWGNWWGNATNEFRRTKERTTEEIDAVGAQRGRVTVVAEVKWTNKPLTASIVTDLDTYKIPALRQSGLKVVAEPRIILLSKSGYAKSLVDLAGIDGRIELIDVSTALMTPVVSTPGYPEGP